MPAQQCTVHKDRETYRICGRCERPFCPDCLVETPVGGRCRECARPPRFARRPVVWWRWPLIVLLAVVGGMVATLIAQEIRFFGLIVGYFAGTLIANGAIAASERRTGTALMVVTVASIVVGVLLAPALRGLADALAAAEVPGDVGAYVRAYAVAGLTSIWTWIRAAVTAFGAVSRFRQGL